MLQCAAARKGARKQRDGGALPRGDRRQVAAIPESAALRRRPPGKIYTRDLRLRKSSVLYARHVPEHDVGGADTFSRAFEHAAAVQRQRPAFAQRLRDIIEVPVIGQHPLPHGIAVGAFVRLNASQSGKVAHRQIQRVERRADAQHLYLLFPEKRTRRLKAVRVQRIEHASPQRAATHLRDAVRDGEHAVRRFPRIQAQYAGAAAVDAVLPLLVNFGSGDVHRDLRRTAEGQIVPRKGGLRGKGEHHLFGAERPHRITGKHAVGQRHPLFRRVYIQGAVIVIDRSLFIQRALPQMRGLHRTGREIGDLICRHFLPVEGAGGNFCTRRADQPHILLRQHGDAARKEHVVRHFVVAVFRLRAVLYDGVEVDLVLPRKVEHAVAVLGEKLHPGLDGAVVAESGRIGGRVCIRVQGGEGLRRVFFRPVIGVRVHGAVAHGGEVGGIRRQAACRNAEHAALVTRPFRPALEEVPAEAAPQDGSPVRTDPRNARRPGDGVVLDIDIPLRRAFDEIPLRIGGDQPAGSGNHVALRIVVRKSDAVFVGAHLQPAYRPAHEFKQRKIIRHGDGISVGIDEHPRKVGDLRRSLPSHREVFRQDILAVALRVR